MPTASSVVSDLIDVAVGLSGNCWVSAGGACPFGVAPPAGEVEAIAVTAITDAAIAIAWTGFGARLILHRAALTGSEWQVSSRGPANDARISDM